MTQIPVPESTRDVDPVVGPPPLVTCLVAPLAPQSRIPSPRPAPRRRWKATPVTLSTPSPPAPALAGTVPCREYWFGLPALRSSVRPARDTVRDRLRAWQLPDDTCGDAVLLVSELTTNAVLHTGSGQVLCGLTLTGDQRRLRIELHDEGRTPVLPPEHRAGPGEESGRGLFLVQQLADTWGSARSTRAEGKVVWAELTAHP